MTELRDIPQSILESLEGAVVGKREVKRLLLIGMMAGGHVLIEGPPGTGKTTTGRAFCQALGGVFKRIQFTPDMLPSDVTGFYIYRTDGDSRFIEGPVFANVVLADELNRTTPRTQAALLESMQEGQVTVEGTTHSLPRPMMVIGSQMPYGGPGTYPLTAVQADRFMLYGESTMPVPEDELRIVSNIDRIELSSVQPVTGPEGVLALRRDVAKVHVSQSMVHYMLALVDAIRAHGAVDEPLSPRVGIALFKSSRAAAYLDGRDFVVPDDVKALLRSVVYHRLVLKPDSEGDSAARSEVIRAAMESVAVPKRPESFVPAA
ncbi:MAG: MoxR family ATPase [Dehalococcoidia bacterium]|nr:MoxR family ATPase [Dehalococcoidia bacterium]